MKYIKKFEHIDSDSYKMGELEDLFMNLEELGYTIRCSKCSIVKDRDDWTGNFVCTKLRNVYGGKFISYNNDVIMRKGSKIYKPEEVVMVSISKISHIEELTDDSIVEHWNKIDKELLSEIEIISKRSNHIIGLNLYGVMAGWFQLGNDTLSDFFMFAFI